MRNILLLFVIITAFSSCKNLVPYTDNMRKQHNWSEDQVRRIQFYVSHEIILHRELSEGNTKIVSGKIKMMNGKQVEEIIIREGTKGVLTEMPKENKMLVSFEVDDAHYLSFGISPSSGDKYVLLASDWNNGMGTVHYAGETFTTDPDSKYAYLMVDLRRLQKLDVKQRFAKGRTVN